MRRGAVLCAVLAASVCASVAGATELSVRVSDGSGAALKDAVVLLTPVGEVPPAPAPAPAPQRAVIDQIDKRFVPRVTVLRTGTAVSFPNHDNIRHSIYSYSTPKRFELKLYAGTPASPVVFDKPGVVALGCNIHDSMIAWVLVVDTPWFVASDGAGAAQLTNLPPGRYRLRAWHEPMAELGEAQELVVGDAPVRMAVTLDPDRTL